MTDCISATGGGEEIRVLLPHSRVGASQMCFPSPGPNPAGHILEAVAELRK